MDKERTNILIKVIEESKKYVENGAEIPIEFQKILFPSGKKECELVYAGKETNEQIISKVISVPLQEEKKFIYEDFKTSNKWVNKLIFGDNVQVLKTLIEIKKMGQLKNADGTDGIRIIYIDPPFSTRKDFRAVSDDQKAYSDKIAGADFLEWLRKRLILLRELLSDNGTIYVHLDYRKNHYIKILMDEIFGETNFKNEIIWHYQTYQGQTKNYNPRKHDSILVYSKSKTTIFYLQKGTNPEDTIDYKRWQEYLNEKNEILGSNYPKTDSRFNGYYKRFIKENRREPEAHDVILKIIGNTIDDVWNIKAVDPKNKTEKTGYPTQKPEALLERIIQSSSNEGDIVLDCFAGSGTTPIVAEKLNRRWIAVDVGKLSIYTIQKRLFNIKKENNRKLNSYILYTAGLYNEEQLNKFDEYNWKLFAMQLWGCNIKPEKVKNFEFDGNRYGDLVKVFTPQELKKIDAKISLETLNSIYQRIGDSAGNNIFIIAPKGQFTFAEDEISIGNVIFNILRIPYSMLARFTEEFTAPLQPKNSKDVNDAVDSVGFDFIQPPFVDFEIKNNNIIIKDFRSNSRINGEEKTELSMLLIDYDYDGEIFDLDEVLYGESDFKDGISKFNETKIKNKAMLIFVDTAGNEKKVIINGK